MRHRVGGYKLKRPVGARNALLRNLATSVILEERVVTTVPKAKAVKPLVEKMITLAKEHSLHCAMQAGRGRSDGTPASVKKLFDVIGPKFGGSATAGIPALCAWDRARAMAPSRRCWNWSVPNW